ncbi:MAG: ferritin family protein [Chloroflexi bacterium]|nr:ferritin family protein [Chloroflexota bacterium]
MVTEQDRILAALRVAIEMETEGRECYLQASQESGNELGRKLLQSLAYEEDLHQKKFEEIYRAISGKEAWPKVEFRPDAGKGLRDLFDRTCHAIGINIKPETTELDAVQTAIGKEGKSYDFYKRQSKNAVYEAEREFYEALAAEEREHELVLLDYYEYFTDPVGWFVKKERSAVDGG